MEQIFLPNAWPRYDFYLILNALYATHFASSEGNEIIESIEIIKNIVRHPFAFMVLETKDIGLVQQKNKTYVQLQEGKFKRHSKSIYIERHPFRWTILDLTKYKTVIISDVHE